MSPAIPVFDPPPTHVGRPIAITAQKWDGTKAHAELLCAWADLYQGQGSSCYIAPDNHPHSARPARIAIHAKAGTMAMLEGEWLIKGTENEFYPCPDTVITTKYDTIPTPLSQDDHADISARLHSSNDAVLWAKEFCLINPTMDEGTMIGWFANAFQTAIDIPRNLAVMEEVRRG